MNLLRTLTAWHRPASRSQPGATAPRARHFVDFALQWQGTLYVAGWCSADASFSLVAAGQPVSARQVRLERGDVAQAGVPRPASGQPHGFAMAAELEAADAPVVLRLSGLPGGEVAETALQPVGLDGLVNQRLGALGGILPELLSGILDASADPVRLARHFQDSPGPPPGVAGGLDQVAGDLQTGHGFCFGWLHAGRRSLAWMECPDAGLVVGLDGAFRSDRDDVTAVLKDLPGGRAGIDLAFTQALQGVDAGQRWQLKVLTDAGVFTVAESLAKGLPANPLLAYRAVAQLDVPLSRAALRMPRVDWPLVEPMITAWQGQLAALPVDVREAGTLPASPRVSIVIPLYGRLDFVEPQLMKFGTDPWLRAHAELIYVLDDPTLVETFSALAPTAAALYGIGFRWVWGGANRGFSGANNLGRTVANAPTLIFLNSDVFPIQPGWAATLCAVLDDHPGIGAVAPRLLHADGSLQHAGIQPLWRDDLGIWINHHPSKGLAPALDPQRELSVVPAVTGACLAVRRQDLDAVGGWDTGYLAGDFEDTDLCFKLRERGLESAYQPAVEMTHLERQSFSSLGSGGFRTRLAILNAVRHQRRWAPMLHALAAAVPRALAGPEREGA